MRRRHAGRDQRLRQLHEDDNAAAIDVLANDTDIDGGPKTIASASDPANGTVVVAGDNLSLTYQPDANYCNDGAPPDDTFTYTLNGGSQATVSVTVSCVDDMPTAVNDSATVGEDSGATAINVLGERHGHRRRPEDDRLGDPAQPTAPWCSPAAAPGPTPASPTSPIRTTATTAPRRDDTFTYTLNGGSPATVSVAVSCVDDAPAAVSDSASFTEDDAATAINVLGNDTDIDGGPKTISNASDPANGTVVLTGGSSGAHTGLTYQPDANYCNDGPAPDDTFTYTLNGGSQATVSVAVSCVDDMPVAVNDSASFTEDDNAATINVLANDTDVDGGPKQIASASDPANGTVVVAGGHLSLTYKPDANYCNDGAPPDDTFTYTLNGGSQATVSVAVSCVDDMPTAVNDSATVGEDSGANAIDVLANDTDIDAGPKTVANASDPDHGTVVITGGGSGLTYEPDSNYCNDGPAPDDTFTYTLNGGSQATVSVAVSCGDDAPVAVNDSGAVTEDDSATTFAVLANDTDVDGGTKEIASASDPANGTVVIAGDNLSLTYQPDPNYCNDGAPPDDTFTYTLNGGSQATVSVAVSCVDDAPVAVNDSATKSEDSGATAINVLANDTDIDAGPKTISSASDPANGTVVLTGGSAGAHTGLTYEPDPNYCNDGAAPDDTFTYTLNGGSQATVSVAVTCVDDAPVAVNDSPAVTEDDSATTVNVLANDTDIDGGPKQIASATQPAHGTVVVAGDNLSLTYQPNPNYCNDGAPPDDTFTYTLNGGSQATVSVAVSCVDDMPTAVNDSATVDRERQRDRGRRPGERHGHRRRPEADRVGHPARQRHGRGRRRQPLADLPARLGLLQRRRSAGRHLHLHPQWRLAGHRLHDGQLHRRSPGCGQRQRLAQRGRPGDGDRRPRQRHGHGRRPEADRLRVRPRRTGRSWSPPTTSH